MSSPHTLHNYNSLNRGQTVRRIPELIDGLKAEYDTLLRDTNMFVMQRDEYEKQRMCELISLSLNVFVYFRITTWF